MGVIGILPLIADNFHVSISKAGLLVSLFALAIATAVCGLFISGIGTQYVVLGGLLFLILSIVSVLLRVYMFSPAERLSN
jgi:predicted MFS family arabinose efflux permease